HDQPGGIEIRIFGNDYAGRVDYPDALVDLVGDVHVACGIHGNARGTQRCVQGWLANCGLVAAWDARAGDGLRLAVRRDTDHHARKLRGIKIPLPVDRHIASQRLADGSHDSIRSNVAHAAPHDVQTTTTIRGDAVGQKQLRVDGRPTIAATTSCPRSRDRGYYSSGGHLADAVAVSLGEIHIARGVRGYTHHIVDWCVQ